MSTNGSNAMITNQSGKFQPEEAVKRFNKRYQALSIVAVFLVFFALFMSLYFVSCAKSPTVVVIRLRELLVTKAFLEQKYGLLIVKPNRTLEENMFLVNLPEQAAALQTQADQLYALNDEIWNYAIGGFAAGIVLTLFPLILLIVFRNNTHVRSRGLVFTIHLLIGSIGFMIAAFCQAAWTNIQFDNESKTERELLVQSELCYIFATLFLNIFFWAIVSRMRIIYHAFHKDHSSGSSMLDYFKILPACFLIYIIPIIPSLLALADVYHGDTRVIFMLPSTTILYVWILFYTYKCKDISHRFSDFYINCIVMTGAYALSLTVMVVSYHEYYSAYSAFSFFYPFYIVILVYLYCPVIPILYIMYKEKHFIADDEKNMSSLSSRSNTFTSTKSTNHEKRKSILSSLEPDSTKTEELIVSSEIMITEC